LCIRTVNGNIVFELKYFVRNADSNKKMEFPNQIGLLEKELSAKNVGQVIVIAISAYIGYSLTQMQNMKNMFNDRWNIIGSKILIDKFSLFLLIAELHK
jgi:hypothetical protein